MKIFGSALLAAFLSLSVAWLLSTSIRMTGWSIETSPSVMTSPEILGRGGEFYQLSCSECHGDDATGDEGPDLHRLPISDAHIAVTIKKGIKGEMPGFAKKYDTQQVKALVIYLRSLP